tara:strand:- start:2143 stop:3147 length:1005 start_codon:yes stop_codon:yes gene_type:complete
MLRFKQFILEKDMYKHLTAGELLKPGREGRGMTVIKKINDNEEFLLKGGGTVRIKKDAALVKDFKTALEKGEAAVLNKFEFPGQDGKTYKLNNFLKSPEFGGKGSGSGTRAEDAALSAFKKELYNVLNKENVPFIYLKIGKRTEKVSEIASTPGTPKSDFHMMDPTGKEVFWISHKKGRKANDFQQYGGMVEIQNEAEVKQFVKDLKATLQKEHGDANKFPMKTGYYRPVKNKLVQMKTLFGKDYRTGKASGRQNIDVLYQGPMTLKKIKSGDTPTYEIRSNHTMFHGDLTRGDYQAYYYVRPEQAKNQFGVKGGRFFIVSKMTATKNRNAKQI